MQPFLDRVRSFVIRYRFRIADVVAVAVATGAVLFGAVSFDIFTNASGQKSDPFLLEFDELLAVAAVLVTGLVWTIARLVRQRREDARRAEVEREIRQLAFHDPLTGLPNRRKFDDAFKVAAGSPPASGASHALLMLDLNGFKRINDVYGHGAGDEVLIQVAARVQKAVRGADVVARLGGDEFAVLATHVSGAQAATGLALRILEELETAVPAAGAQHAVGTAIGIALLPQDGTTPAELMRKADIALYAAKAEGHSAFRFFDAAMDHEVRARDDIQRRLRAAIEARSIGPHYVPSVDVDGRTVRGFEVRPHWVDAELGEVGPETFVPIAEDCGLIGPLTMLLLEQACRDAASWPNAISLAIGVSPVLLRAPGFGLQVVATLDKTDFSPARLELQITESALVRDLEAAKTALGGLRDLGVKITLDGFGTGYSSLYHLRNFKLDRIKIDGSFISALAADKDSAAIVRALVGLGTGLGLEVAAAGVETEGQRSLLAAMGCEQTLGPQTAAAVDSAAARDMVAGEVRRHG